MNSSHHTEEIGWTEIHTVCSASNINPAFIPHPRSEWHSFRSGICTSWKVSLFVDPPSPKRGRTRLKLQTAASSAAQDARHGWWWRWGRSHRRAARKLNGRRAGTAARRPAAPPSIRRCRKSERVHWVLERSARTSDQTQSGFAPMKCSGGLV